MSTKRIAITFLLTGMLAIASCTNPGLNPTSSPASTQSQPPSLNSERIRQKFGSYGVDVIRQDDRQRVSNLYSIENGSKITRTLAVVFYPEFMPVSLLAEHDEIIGGQSIGETFKSTGWKIQKQNVYLGELSARPEFDNIYHAMGETIELDLPVHIYQLWVIKNGERYTYATIAEVHDPEYMNLAELNVIYGMNAIEPGLNKDSVHKTLDTVAEVLEQY